MVSAAFSLPEDYWETLEIQDDDIDFLYNRLMETETPQTSWELTMALVEGRILREKRSIEEQRTSGGDTYLPKGQYKIDQRLVVPVFGWRKGRVIGNRPGQNPGPGEFRLFRWILEW
jgi:hypothetical protein